MKKMGFRHRLIILSSIAIVAIAIAATLFTQNKGIYVKYREFNELFTEGKISTVTINTENIQFEKVGYNGKYYTDNPKTDDFKERLLLSGIEVKDSTEDDGFVVIFDILFDIAFIGFIVIVI